MDDKLAFHIAMCDINHQIKMDGWQREIDEQKKKTTALLKKMNEENWRMQQENMLRADEYKKLLDKYRNP